ncbi:hypothetical protein D0Z00_004355 [Geotrichum galactomycetum]|uniref:Uncharacterized protein n=1 Tax=Geotrichum galactomycetum TaxID=27317 RepID=A0ACB6UYP6_9ASCO|nr:hypothetical protein D0Z00_004355 [Geotrichum candidum]
MDDVYELDADADADQRAFDLFENINRLTGITGFKVKAPNPEEPTASSSSSSAKNPAYMLGIRFDVSVAGQYSIPHYIIIRQKPAYKPVPEVNKAGTIDHDIEILQHHDLHELEIFQHTIPAFLPVQDLAREYLNTNLRQFAASVRARLVAHGLRQHVFAQQLSHPAGSGGGGGPPLALLGRRVTVVESNLEYTRVRLAVQPPPRRRTNNSSSSGHEATEPREVQLDCVEDHVVCAKVSDSTNAGARPLEPRDLPLLQAFQGPVVDLPARLLAYYDLSTTFT